MASEIRVNKIANRAGLSTVEYTDTGIIVSGIVTCTEISGLNALNIAGVSTFASPLDINGDIDVDGHTNLDNLSVAGVTTFTGNISGTTAIFDDFLNVGSNIKLGNAGVITATSFSGSGASLTNLNASNIASGTVPTARLGSGTASSSTFLRGDSTFQTVNTDLVSDTSPQLGGDLESNTHNIKMADSSYTADENKIYCGNFLDFKIYHDGIPYQNILQSNGAIPIIIKPKDTDVGLKVLPDSGVELYWDNAKKFETTNTGAVVTGILTATSFSGDGSSLSNLPAGAPVGGASTNTVFFENDKAVAVNYQITSTKNAMTAGPVAINAGIAVTVPSGCAWTIV